MTERRTEWTMTDIGKLLASMYESLREIESATRAQTTWQEMICKRMGELRQVPCDRHWEAGREAARENPTSRQAYYWGRISRARHDLLDFAWDHGSSGTHFSRTDELASLLQEYKEAFGAYWEAL